MKQLLLLLAFALPLSASAQKRVSADALAGTDWKMVIHMDEKVDEADNALARMALSAVAGLLDDIDVRFHFFDNNKVGVTARVFGEEANVDDKEEATWEINRHGGLIMGDSKHFESDSDTVFYFVGDELVAFELNADGKPAERKELSLVRLDS
jgi:hypothetical protein